MMLCSGLDIRSRLFLTLLLLFLMDLMAFPDPVSCGIVTAGSIEIKGLQSVQREELLDMMGIHEGGPVDEAIVREGIKRAFLKGIFEDISVRVVEGAPRTIAVDVIERDVINKIIVRVDDRLSEKTIKGLFSLKEGEVLRSHLLQGSAEELKEKLAGYGFPSASVDIKTIKIDAPYRVDLYLTLDPGPARIVTEIKLNLIPPHRLPEGIGPQEIFSLMKLTSGDVYNLNRIDIDLKNIKDFIKGQGYYKPVIGPASFKDGVLEIVIDPGRQLSVSMEGNKVISTKELIKAVHFFEIEDVHDEVIGEAIDRMLAAYHREGYPFAQIAPVINSDEQKINISFYVYEGDKVTVASVSFMGAELPHAKLRDVMSIKEGGPYNPDLRERDRDELKEFYGALGYLDAQVKDIETEIDRSTGTAFLNVNIEEGRKTVIEAVEIADAGPEIKNDLISVVGIKAGDPYNEVDISDARYRILDYFVNHGYPNTDVMVSRDLKDYKVSVVFRVREGEKKFFGKTIVVGNKMTKYEVIKREALFSEGQPYNFRTIAEARQKLYKLGLFTSVEMETVDAGGDRKDILIKLNEGDPGAVEFGLGYAEYEKFRGFAQVSYRNLWGMNREGLMRLELSSLEKRYILQYNEPWFKGRQLPFKAFFLFEKRTELNAATHETLYRLNRYSFTAGVEKKLGPAMKTDLYYEFSMVRTLDVQPDVILSKEDTGTLAISSVKSSLVYDKRDNPLEPQNGILAGISLKAASFLLLSETNFVKMEMYGNKYHKLGKRVTLALSLRGGLAFGYAGTEELPIVERFFLGGRSTVRGYPQDTLGAKGADGNPTGGNAYLMGNIEFRTNVGMGIGLVPFFDVGNVWVRIKDIDPTELKYTTGLGLRYATPVGPLRVDFGVKLNRETGESRSELHFSIGHAF